MTESGRTQNAEAGALDEATSVGAHDSSSSVVLRGTGTETAPSERIAVPLNTPISRHISANGRKRFKSVQDFWRYMADAVQCQCECDGRGCTICIGAEAFHEAIAAVESARASDARLTDSEKGKAIGSAEKKLAGSGETAPAWQPEWRDIETAPEQKPVWVSWVNAFGHRRSTKAVYFPAGTLDMDDEVPEDDRDEEGHNIEAGWFEDREAGEPSYWPLRENLTHWMPLPSPPSGGPR